MAFLSEMGELALGSRFKALSDHLYETADAIYRARGSAVQGRWFPVLRLLHDRGALAVTEVAREIGQTHSAVSQLATKLKREGWIRIVADRSDKRRSLLALTAKAERALREIKPVWKAIRETLAERLAAEQVDLLGTLAAFEASLEATPLAAQILERCAQRDRAAVRIVPFAPALREHFYRLNADWLRKHFYLEAIDHRVLSSPEEEILAGGGAILFATLDDAVVGTVALKRDSAGIYELTKMAVEERHQGLGIGRKLLEAAIAQFKRRKGRTLFLESNRKLAPALRLYESLGFEHQSARKPDSHYQRSDVYMVWRDKAARRKRAA